MRSAGCQSKDSLQRVAGLFDPCVSWILSRVWSPLTIIVLRPSGDSPPPSVYRHLPTPSSSVPHAQTLPSTSTRPRGDAGPTASPAKRRHVPDTADVEVVKKIRQSEVELRYHNTVLRVIERNAYVAKLKSLKEAKRTGAAAPIATPLSGIVVYYHHIDMAYDG
jgi:hypothetical protein